MMKKLLMKNRMIVGVVMREITLREVIAVHEIQYHNLDSWLSWATVCSYKTGRISQISEKFHENSREFYCVLTETLKWS